ncbi:hypothetical protein QR680_014521 [Steinernema hermaphroditum]|uniref:F-box domain-containing protein n=1 Tax=Steinernema hermaphroditum TaxID=289476 RepID=A0AA39M4B8_9BILA|nr:hypothetical protein QR680_014521 [Steinernema hermaphroditum]
MASAFKIRLLSTSKYVMLAFDSLSIGVDFCTAYKALSDYNEYRPIDMLYKGALILCCLYGVGLKLSQWKIRREHDGYKIALAGMRIRKISCKVDISLNNTSNGTKSTKSFSVLVKFKYIPERSDTTSVITALNGITTIVHDHDYEGTPTDDDYMEAVLAFVRERMDIWDLQHSCFVTAVSLIITKNDVLTQYCPLPLEQQSFHSYYAMGTNASILHDDDQINELPDEVLVMIFRCTFGYHYTRYDYNSDVNLIGDPLPLNEKTKEKALRPLRLVCSRWNRLITGFFVFRRWVTAYLSVTPSGMYAEIPKRPRSFEYYEYSEWFLSWSHLRYFTNDITTIFYIFKRSDPLQANEMHRLRKFTIYFGNIRFLSLKFSCIDADLSEIAQFFTSLQRPHTLKSLHILIRTISEDVKRALTDFIKSHPNLKECYVFTDTDCVLYFKELLSSIITEPDETYCIVEKEYRGSYSYYHRLLQPKKIYRWQ